MYLYVEFVDGWSPCCQAEQGVKDPVTKRRVVRVKLTEEQTEQLKPRTVGSRGGKLFYEDINLISIQED